MPGLRKLVAGFGRRNGKIQWSCEEFYVDMRGDAFPLRLIHIPINPSPANIMAQVWGSGMAAIMPTCPLMLTR